MTPTQLKALMAWIDARIAEKASQLALQGYVVIGDTPGKVEKVARRALAEAFGIGEGGLEG